MHGCVKYLAPLCCGNGRLMAATDWYMLPVCGGGSISIQGWLIKAPPLSRIDASSRKVHNPRSAATPVCRL